MDNKQKTEKEQPQQPASSEAGRQGKTIQNETGDLLPEQPNLSEASGKGNFIQHGVKWLQDRLEQLQDQFIIDNQQMKNTNIDTIRSNIKVVLDWLCRLENGYHLTLQDINNVQRFLNTVDGVLESYSILQQDNESLISSNAGLQKDKQGLTKQYNELVDKYNIRARQSQANSRLQQKYESLTSINTALQDEIQQLKQERDAFKKERDQLASDRGGILSELAEKNRDKNTTYVGSDSRPQHHLLFQEFKQLKEQEFHAVSSGIFLYRCERKPSLKANRKQEIANIKSILSKEIIIEGLHLSRGDSEFSVDAVKVVSHSVRSALGIPDESEITEALNNEIESLLKKGMKLVNGKNSTDNIEGLWTEKDFTKAVKDISNSVYSALEMVEEYQIPEALRNDIKNLVKKGLELVKKIASADPPGVLRTEKEGTPFKSDRHEAMLGCEEGGKILWTIYPGYLVGDRVFEKALVFTVPEEEAESADNKSEHKDEIQGT